jgi:CheY-like chemotaxis protein
MRKVLVIDDEKDVRYIAQISLGRIGNMIVIEASSGQEGIARAKSEHPDFILLDMMMPGMDGAATFRALREDEETASIPVIFLTAVAKVAEVQCLKDLGARGVVLKPFDPITLASDLTAMLES